MSTNDEIHSPLVCEPKLITRVFKVGAGNRESEKRQYEISVLLVDYFQDWGYSIPKETVLFDFRKAKIRI